MGMLKLCQKFAQYMPNYAQDMPKVGPRYAQYMPKIYKRYQALLDKISKRLITANPKFLLMVFLMYFSLESPLWLFRNH